MVLEALKYYLTKNFTRNLTLFLLMIAAVAAFGYGRQAINIVFNHETTLKNTTLTESTMQTNDDYRTWLVDRMVP